MTNSASLLALAFFWVLAARAAARGAGCGRKTCRSHRRRVGRDTAPPNPLPPAATTSHELKFADRTLKFTAKAGAIRLSDANSGAPLADIAYVAFLKDGEDPAKRPITFAFNGGPGAGSAWLDLGALGPWRLPLDAGALSPSASPRTVDNAETWLDFTDLVFIDAPETGYSRTLNKDAAKSF